MPEQITETKSSCGMNESVPNPTLPQALNQPVYILDKWHTEWEECQDHKLFEINPDMIKLCMQGVV